MNATLTVMPENVCRVQGVPRPLLGRLMVRVINAHELKDLRKVAPSEDGTALDLYGVDFEGREVIRRLIAEITALDVLRHLPPAVQAQLSGG